MRWFTSDLHFGHKNVIEYCSRPFTDVDDMARGLIANYNQLVAPTDIVYFLGDITFANATNSRKYISQLNGYKILVKGNHDHKSSKMCRYGFDLVTYGATILIGDEIYKLSHYPYGDARFPTRSPVDQGGWILHGHTHSKEKFRDRQIHVGVDAWNYWPVSEVDIITLRRNHG